MRHRRTLVALLAASMSLVVAAAAGASPPTKVGMAYDAAGLGDVSFNDAAQSGALQAETDFGVKLFEVEQVKGSGELRDAEKVLTKLAKRSDLVVAVGFTYESAAAAADPDTNFAVLDLPFAAPPPNMLATTMAGNEGSFLVGAAAAMESTSGQIGFIGGVDFSVIFEFEAGFVAGVDHVDPGASVTVEYVSLVPDFSGFNDPGRAYDIATDMYQSGVDVIYHAAGASGIGLFHAARDHSLASGDHVWAIGVDADQYLQVAGDLQPHILTSMIKQVDVITYDIIESQVLGTFTGGTDHWDLSRNGVDYATSGGFVDAYVPALEDIKQDIIDGLILVPTVP
jgi:basic membrane protein A